MDKHQKYLNTLGQIASAVEPVATSRLAAAIVYKNEIVAVGINKNKSHPLQKRFSKNTNSIFLHAEIDVIKNALRVISQDELSKSTLYVCRMKYPVGTKSRMIRGMACPCPGCSKAIAAFNIPRVIYSLDNTNDYGMFA